MRADATSGELKRLVAELHRTAPWVRAATRRVPNPWSFDERVAAGTVLDAAVRELERRVGMELRSVRIA
ncbi:hypothetical protein [Rathayibacter rathayi]|uniref:Uncharacterized protein n=1 Tax=Rathayibacter rathayi TaxID=33887 RepID=A0ABX5AEA5_RATRA|nr:hypothetical protein [Rathayibacter rathayi]PPF24238.1 hypothetical protein C5C34_05770 [Rathayibacter rathayi]PPF51559.1 hypothetical protein C5C08_01760 [Rathayibacter rathayi]PPF83150.1 hypothetical protein C5C14_01800 [Rathayibacter rathayi]PPG46980.1 hypothetical protein C5C20_01755 [Rathayibacter rathayi]PPG96558.1 hypothetical protein C5C22_02770 [Rathayibacter rathayi]